ANKHAHAEHHAPKAESDQHCSHHANAEQVHAPPTQHSCCSHSSKHEHHVKPAHDIPMPEGTIYTCPMHPEVRQVGPGSCPKCGMALEPEMPTEHVDDTELRAVRQKFWIALALALPVVVIAMTPHF